MNLLYKNREWESIMWLSVTGHSQVTLHKDYEKVVHYVIVV